MRTGRPVSEDPRAFAFQWRHSLGTVILFN